MSSLFVAHEYQINQETKSSFQGGGSFSQKLGEEREKGKFGPKMGRTPFTYIFNEMHVVSSYSHQNLYIILPPWYPPPLFLLSYSVDIYQKKESPR